MNKKMDPRIIIIILVIILAPAFLLYYYAPWDPIQPGVITRINSSGVDILYLKTFRYGETMMCGMCAMYLVNIEVFSDGEKICSDSHGILDISTNESHLIGVKCPELSNFIGKEVNIIANGSIEDKSIGATEKVILVPSEIK